MSPRLPSNKPAEVTEENAATVILEALTANAKASGAAASARSREGQNGPAAAAFASAVRDLADALRALETPPPSPPETPVTGSRSRTPWAQRARAWAEQELQS
jgi:hypothetical protein